ncbi:hypothetical protein JL720_16877 [Aureococcus anophagefferens]|nr:hypothetical protein JL720_16877 [Aureococcus anophagefferens]
MAAAALRVAVALGLVRRAAGVGEFQDCIACGSNNLNWKDMDHCERFEPLSQIKWNFEVTHRRADVWVYIVEDQRWLKMENLEGDFFARTDEAFLMEDVLDPGDVAPFWERFGHSLDVFPALNVSATTGEVMGKINAMVLLGVHAAPDNDAVDVRATASAGSAPLTNDAWAGDFNTTGSVETRGHARRMSWEAMAPGTGSFEAPETWSILTTLAVVATGHGATVQFSIRTNESRGETLYLTGGLARTRTSPPAPRIWLAGGGYVGKKGNSVVEFVDAYYDLWWSRDGATWTQVCETVQYNQRLHLGLHALWGADSAEGPRRTASPCPRLLHRRRPGLPQRPKLSPSKDVYVSRAPVLCEVDGHKCLSEGYAPRYSIVNTDNRFAYTVYNITEYGSDQRHPLSMAGMYVHEDNETSYQGFVARLEGCRCAENFEGSTANPPLDAATPPAGRGAPSRCSSRAAPKPPPGTRGVSARPARLAARTCPGPPGAA